MGRGRAKAKQTKVARELKYNSGGFDPDALRAELVHDDHPVTPATGSDGADSADDSDDDRDDA